MPIREPSFRIGCGRYLQGADMLKSCGKEIARCGNSPLIVGDKTSLSLTSDTLGNALSDTCENFRLEQHDLSCNHEHAKEIAELARSGHYNVIVGVGGGVIMDFAKLIAHYAGLPVINIPTSSATCAAYTPLSVCYTPEGKTVGTTHLPCEVNGVIADSEILAGQPTRLLLAGVFDAMAKFVEIKHQYARANGQSFPLGLDYAFSLSESSYRFLTGKTEEAIADIARGELTDTVENLFFTSIAVTGVISGIARGSNQCALAHRFYESARVLHNAEVRPFLHGELVGIGLTLQNLFCDHPDDNNSLLTTMKQYKMPYCTRDVGIPSNEATIRMYYERLCESSSIDKNNEKECKKLNQALHEMWNIQ